MSTSGRVMTCHMCGTSECSWATSTASMPNCRSALTSVVLPEAHTPTTATFIVWDSLNGKTHAHASCQVALCGVAGGHDQDADIVVRPVLVELQRGVQQLVSHAPCIRQLRAQALGKRQVIQRLCSAHTGVQQSVGKRNNRERRGDRNLVDVGARAEADANSRRRLVQHSQFCASG